MYILFITIQFFYSGTSVKKEKISVETVSTHSLSIVALFSFCLGLSVFVGKLFVLLWKVFFLVLCASWGH